MFKKDFAWGSATAAYQVEGAAYEDGRGESVWDVFSHTDGKVKNGHTGDVACDHYHRYKEDVSLMKELGIKAYRFSVSWTRILPEGTGKINQKGVDFYNNLINELISAGIEPYMTLFHWDYPYALEKRGGWLNDESPKWFEEYARTVYSLFSDRVKHFITFNEPQCFIGIGYRDGVHAPGLKRCEKDIVVMAHNVMKAHGLAVRALREIAPDCLVGYAPTEGPAIPFSDSPEDIEAARKKYFDVTAKSLTWNVAWWSDPVMLGSYPEETEAFKAYGKYLPESYKEDLKIISEPIDFYGQNIYNGSIVKAGNDGYEWVPNPINTAKTAIGWPVTPKALYWGPKFLYERYKKPILITENGMSCHDTVSLDGKVHDPNRIDYTHRYLRELSRAADDGVDIKGYMHWSLMDNFEWACGYTERFGLIYVDFETGQRIKKDSFYWYSQVIKTNGENL